jgi:hypothetical protein
MLKGAALMVRTALVALSLAIGSIACVDTAAAQSLQQRLAGIWTYVDNYNLLPDGRRVQPMGPNGQGILMLDPGGRFSWIYVRPDLPKFASNNRQTGTDAENKAVAQGSLAYYGTYTIDEPSNSIVMRIEYSSYPNFKGAEQRRSIKFDGEQLTIINQAAASGGTAYAIWKRAR